MRLLVIRTSAMGDVALTVPVLKAMREQHPDIGLVLVTRASYKAFFSSVNGLELFCPDLKVRHKGIRGILQLYKDLKKQSEINKVIDLHDVLRSKVLRLLYKISGIPVFVIDKGRKEKRALITGKNKKQLKHSVERYADVFARAGYPVIPAKENLIVPPGDLELKPSFQNQMNGFINIGVAPYAKHELKMWPGEYMIRLLNLISEKYKCKFWLFGGNEDAAKLEIMQNKVPGSTSLADSLSLEEELLFMSRLDLMIAMDSSNMHMAALTGTKVISIWGGTDPLAGFSAWMQPDSYSIRVPVEELNCRPCTIYGKGKSRNNLSCMKLLTPELVFKRIEKIVLSKYIQ